MRAKRLLRLQEALNALDPLDRVVLSMRHFEELSNQEVAQALNLTAAAASMRYLRAMRKLREMLKEPHASGEQE